MQRHLATTLLVTLLVTLGGGAQGQKRMPPLGGVPGDFVLPPTTTFQMDNGLKATFLQYGTIPKAWIVVLVRAGNINEASDQVWLADLTGSMMKQGTLTRGADAVARAASEMGGDVSIVVGEDRTMIAGNVLSEFSPDFVRLVGDITRNPRFPAAEIDRLKADQLRQLSVAKADPQSIVLSELMRALYPNHPYGRAFPTEEMIRNYTVDDVRSFYAQNFGAGRTHIFVAGRFDAKDTESAVRKAFSGWEKGSDPPHNVPKPVARREIRLIDRPGALQSTVILGLPVIDPSHPDYRALLLTNALLGGSFASRITSNIREDKGYAYSPNSVVTPRYRDAYWSELADVGTEVTGASLKEILREITRLQEVPPTPEELKGIQNYMAGMFVLENSSAGSIINQLSFLDLHGLQGDYLENEVREIYGVTPGRVQSIVRKYLRARDMTIVILGDRKKIERQVSTIGPIVEEIR